MNRIKNWQLLAMVLLLGGTAWAEEAAAKVVPLRLAVDLTDGSHVIGVPGVKVLPLDTPYANMKIEWEKIHSVKIESDHKSVAVELQNGDRIKGTLAMKQLELEAAFGKISIVLDHIIKIGVLPGGSASGQLPPELLEKLVLHYRFNRLENDGQTATDLSEGKHEGTIHGASAVPDERFGRVLQFDGTKDYMDVDSDCAISKHIGQGDFSIVVWIKPQQQQAETAYILEQHFPGTPWTGMYLSLETGKCRFRTEDSRSSGSHVVFDAQNLFDEKWHCIVALRKNSVLQLFLDGEKLAGKKVPLADFNTNYAGPLRMGAHSQDGSGANYKGLIAGLMIYERTLTEAEIARLATP
jgi:hypothetical protein